jgi:hypothetical protein
VNVSSGIQRPRRAVGEVRQVHERPDHPRDRLRVRRHLQPVVERAALIDLEVTEADPAELGRIDDPLHRLEHLGEHPPHARVVEERLIIHDEEVIELQVDLAEEDADAVDAGGDFSDEGHV